MNRSSLPLAMLAGAAILAGACAHPPKPPPPPERVYDSVPERAAALRDSEVELHSQAEDQRWGIEDAKEMKKWKQELAEPPARTAVIPMPPPNDSGVFSSGADGGDAR